MFSPDEWATILIGSERQLDALATFNVPSSIEARVVRGYRCTEQESLFSEWAAALQFPYYFGRNWGAFDDCVGDLSWLGKSKIAVLIACSDALLADDSDHFERFVEGLVSAVFEPVRTWMADEPTPARELRVGFHADSAGAIRARLGTRADGVTVIDLGPESAEQLESA